MSETSNPNKYVGNELEYLRRILCSENWSSTTGSWNKTLETKFAEKFGAKYAVAFNSGTATLHAALEAVGVRPGDEVITPALAPFMCTSAILHANAIPVYADVYRHTFTIDASDIEKKITPKTRSIIAVALYGLPAFMDTIMHVAKKYNIAVIEDNAQCFLSRCHGIMSGTIGDIASYSFENTKHISCGEGGIIITNNKKYAETCRKIGGHGFKNLTATDGQIKLNEDVFQDPDYKRHDCIGWNYRLPEFNAGISLAQLERLDDLVEMRIKSASFFTEAVKDCPWIIPQSTPSGYDNSYYTYGMVYNGAEDIGVSWKEFRRGYIANGGDGFYGSCSIPYHEPVITTCAFRSRCPQIYDSVSYDSTSCPVAESLQPKIMQLKTNYRNMDLAKRKADALRRTINQYDR